MIYITYENETGRLHLNGGNGIYPWKVIDISGLELAGKSLNTAVYPSQVGQTTVSETVDFRTITMSCDVYSRNSNRFEISKALKILNEPGILSFFSSYGKRKIKARCVSAVPGERHGGYQTFALQFVCDYPYFEDWDDTTIPIYKIEKLIGSGKRYWYENDELKYSTISPDEKGSAQFILPCMFSRRTTDATVMNIGDVDTEPIIIITILGNANEGNLIIYKDKGTDAEQKLELMFTGDYIPENGDVITVDIPKRQIYNQKGDNLLPCLSQDSFLSDFWLNKGKNMIEVENEVSTSCTVVCKYSNKYVEAVIA